MSLRAKVNRAPGNRGCNRLRIDAAAQLVLTHETKPCLLHDISATGARVRVDGQYAVGRSLILRFHELKIYCTVAWRRGDACGLRFESPLPSEDMKGMLWITQNRETYERICLESRVRDWSSGIGD